MHCEEVRTLLDRGLESGLDLQESAGLQEHVAHCENCRQAHDRMLRFLAVLELGPDRPPPPGFADRVLRQVREDSRGTAGFFPSVLQVVFAVAVVVAFGLAVLALEPRGMTDAFSRAYLLPALQLQDLLARGAEIVALLVRDTRLFVPVVALSFLALLALATRSLGSGHGHGGADGR